MLEIVKSGLPKLPDIRRKSKVDNPFAWASFDFLPKGKSAVKPGDYKSQIKSYSSWCFRCSYMNAVISAEIPLRLYIAKTNRKKMWNIEVKELSKEKKDYFFKSPSFKHYLKKAVDIEEIVEHPFLELLKNVNPWMNEFDLAEATTLDLELTGNAYWLLIFNSLKIPQEIWLLPSQFVEIIPSKEKFISGFKYRRESFEKEFSPEEIVFFKYQNPKHILYGHSPAEGGADAITINQYMHDYQVALFLNEARPDYYLLAKEPLAKDQRDRILGELRRRYSGPKKAGEPGILEGGLDVKTISFPPKDLVFQEGVRMIRDEISAMFGVPVSLLTVEDVNRANAVEGNPQYMRQTILPILRRREQKLNEKLLPLYDEKLFCAYDNPVPDDREFRLKEKETHLRTGYSSINEERQKDGVDPAPWGDVPYMPMNLLPLGSPVSSKIFDLGRIAERIAQKLTVKSGEQYRKRKWEIFVKRADLHEGLFKMRLVDLFGEQERVVLANMKKTPKEKVNLDIIDSWLFPRTEWEEKFEKEGRIFALRTLIESGKGELAEVLSGSKSIKQDEENPGFFDEADPRVIEFLNEYVPKFSFVTNDETIEQLMKTLKEGIEAGEGIPKLKERVQGVFEFAKKYRALRIARSETIRASNAGAEIAYKQSGIVKGKEWLTAFDERTCPWCESMNGKIVSLDENFFDKGDRLETEGRTMNLDYSDVGYPPLHPLCRCALIPVLI